MNTVIKTLGDIKELTPDLILHLQTVLRFQRFLKREYLHQSNHICTKLWFVESGLVANFYQRNNKSLCTRFSSGGDIITAPVSFLDQVKSQESLQALEDTAVYYITYDELQGIYKEFPEFNYHGRLLTEKYYKSSELRMQALLSETAIEKYKYMIKYFPAIIRNVSNIHIASYLGVSVQMLSRIKRRI